jgi:hypothetical protein
MKKWWALWVIIGLIAFGIGYGIRNYEEQHLTYKILNVYFSQAWQEGKLGRISLAKFIVVKKNSNIWTIKSGGKVFDIDININDLIFDVNDNCVNRLEPKG